MPLDSYALEAFRAVSRFGTFTEAARRLHLTQSALSQRIAGLEKSLGTTLFLRRKQGAQLTAAGQRLLRFAQAQGKLEEELLGDLGAEFSGTVRVMGFSTVTRSVLLPALTPLLRAHPALRLELQSREVDQIPAGLLEGETDFAVHTAAIDREDVRAELLGHEEYVLVEARKGPVGEAFLDHHEEDEFTFRYFRRFGGRPPKLVRHYLDEAYGLLDGVAGGLGRAVLPRHLVAADARLRVLEPEKALRVPVYLNYFAQPYYTRLHEEVRGALLASLL